MDALSRRCKKRKFSSLVASSSSSSSSAIVQADKKLESVKEPSFQVADGEMDWKSYYEM